MIGLLITVAVFPLVGLSLARRSLPTAFLMGLGLTGSLLFLAGTLRFPLTAAFALLLLLSIVPSLRQYRKHTHRETRTVPFAPLPTVFMAMPLLLLSFIAAVTPLNDFDGRAFWVLKAKAIAHERSIEGPFFSGETLDPRNHYPLLIPLDGAVILSLAHSLDDRQLRWLYIGLLAALALLVRERLADAVSPAAGAWCAALLVWIPQFTVEPEGSALSAYNDIAVAAFAAGALFELVEECGLPALSPPPRNSAIHFGLWLTFLILTKSEGLPFALVFLLIGAFVFRKRIAIAAITPMLATIALFFWRSRIPEGDEENILRLLPTIPEKLHNLRAALGAFPRYMLSMSSWGIFWIVVLVAAVLAMRVDRRMASLSIAVITAMLGVYAAVYVATNWVVADLVAASANRLLMHLVAPALVLIALASQWWTRTKSM